jgi:hypothetical protein
MRSLTGPFLGPPARICLGDSTDADAYRNIRIGYLLYPGPNGIGKGNSEEDSSHAFNNHYNLLFARGCRSRVAQSDRSAITGSVTDAASAVIPDAAIKIRNINTAAVYQSQSSSTGNYTFNQLPAGKYRMSSSAPGFKQYLRRASRFWWRKPCA